jgi:transglutaminase-like putative cysteine protease
MRAVKERVQSSSEVGFKSASQIMAEPYGDCTERSVLAVAMLRSLNIAARPVYGLIFDKEKLYHHMWIEAHNGAYWVPMDPNFQQLPAGPGHIRFLAVSLEQGDYSMIARLLISRFADLTVSKF